MYGVHREHHWLLVFSCTCCLLFCYWRKSLIHAVGRLLLLVHRFRSFLAHTVVYAMCNRGHSCGWVPCNARKPKVCFSVLGFLHLANLVNKVAY